MNVGVLGSHMNACVCERLSECTAVQEVVFMFQIQVFPWRLLERKRLCPLLAAPVGRLMAQRLKLNVLSINLIVIVPIRCSFVLESFVFSSLNLFTFL